MENKKSHIVETVVKSNRKDVERDKIDNITHKYITPQFPGLIHEFQ